MNMKKISSILMVLFAVVLVMTGCADETNKSNETAPEAAVEAVVAKFYDDIKSNNLGNFEDYFTADSTELSKFEAFTPEMMYEEISQVMSSMSVAIGEEAMDDWINKTVGEISGSVDYTINSTEVSGKTAEAFVTLDMVDVSSMSDIDTAPLLEEAFGFDINDTQMLFEKMQEKTGKSYEDVISDMMNTDDDAKNTYIYNTFSEEFNKYLGLYTAEMTKQTVGKDVKLTLKQETDGQWKIKSME